MKHENIRMTLLALAVAVAVAGFARAATETVDGVQWSYDVDAGEAAVTGAEPAAGELTIPSILGGCPVTRIGDNAFASCEGLTGVTIPSSVKRIGKSAFSGCSTLTSVALPEGLKRIESGAFFGTGLETVTVPKSVRWIGGTAFAFTPLQSATVLGGAISGNDGSFTGCNSLKTLTLGTRVSGISYYAFANYASRQVALETVHAPVGWEGKPNPLSGGFFGADFTVVYDNGVDDGEPVEEEEEYEDVWDYPEFPYSTPFSTFFKGETVEFLRKFAHPASRKPPKRRVVKTYPLASQKGRARMSPCFCEPSNDTRTESSISTGRWSRTFASAGACSSGRRST